MANSFELISVEFTSILLYPGDSKSVSPTFIKFSSDKSLPFGFTYISYCAYSVLVIPTLFNVSPSNTFLSYTLAIYPSSWLAAPIGYNPP